MRRRSAGAFSILGLYRGYIGIMENQMETTIVYWGIYYGYNRVYTGDILG